MIFFCSKNMAERFPNQVPPPPGRHPLIGPMVAMGALEYELKLPAAFSTSRPQRSIGDRSFFVGGVDLHLYGFRLISVEQVTDTRKKKLKSLEVTFMNLFDEPINVSARIQVCIPFSVPIFISFVKMLNLFCRSTSSQWNLTPIASGTKPCL